jgi:TetR/AcrR family transcriptional repressor of nem operon
MNASTDTRERIVQSARELIYSRSYADVGVAEICKQAGVQKGSFYHFFPSKQDLALAILDEVFTELDAEILQKAFYADLPPLERIRRLPILIAAQQEIAHQATGHMPGCPFGNLAVEMSTQDEAIRQKTVTIFCNMEDYFEKTLNEASKQGEVGDIDTTATAQAMLSYLEGIMLLAKTRNEPELMRKLGPAVADIRILNEGA